MRLIPKEEFYGKDTGKGFFKLTPKEEFYAPEPYPTEPSLFGVTPGRELPGPPEPEKPGFLGRLPETPETPPGYEDVAAMGPPIAEAPVVQRELPAMTTQTRHEGPKGLAWHLIPEDQRIGDIHETINDLEPRKSDPFPEPIVEAIHELHNQGLPIEQIDKALVEGITKGKLPTWEMHISDRPEMPETPLGYEDAMGMGPGIAEGPEVEGPGIGELWRGISESEKALREKTGAMGEAAEDFVRGVGRAAARKLVPPASTSDIPDQVEIAKGLYLGGDPISHEELRDYFVNPGQHGKKWDPMTPEEADRFIKDQQGLEIAEFVTWIAIVGHGIGRGMQGLYRMIRAKIDYKTILETIPKETLWEAEATGDWSKANRHATDAWLRLPTEQRAAILRAKEAFEVKRTVPRVGKPSRPPPAKPPEEGKFEMVPTQKARDEYARTATEYQRFKRGLEVGKKVPTRKEVIEGVEKTWEAQRMAEGIELPPEAPKPTPAMPPAVKEPPIAKTLEELRAIEKEFPKRRKVEEFPVRPPEKAPKVAPREEIRPEAKPEVLGKWEIAPDTEHGQAGNVLLQTKDGIIHEGKDQTHIEMLLRLNLDPGDIGRRGWYRKDTGELFWYKESVKDIATELDAALPVSAEKKEVGVEAAEVAPEKPITPEPKVEVPGKPSPIVEAGRPYREELEKPTPEPEVKPPAKESWEMTKGEWIRRAAVDEEQAKLIERNKIVGSQTIKAKHEVAVRDALSEGKPVPKEVLADYPDLGKLKPTTIMDAELRAKKKQWAEGVAPEKIKGGLFEEARKQRELKLKPPEKAKTFIEWVRRTGGIWDKTLTGEMREFTPKESGVLGLVRKGGRPFDTLLIQAVEDGWLPEGSTDTDFYNMLRDDVLAQKGKKPRMRPFSEMEVGKEIEREFAEAARGEEVRPAKEVERRRGFPITKKEEFQIKRSRQQILKFIEKKLKIPIRIGRFRERAMGVYKVKPQVVRLKKPLDVEVAAHEIGHHLRRVLGLMGKGDIPQEVAGLAYPGAKDKTEEGFAEFMRFYLTDEAKARRAAREFYKTLDEKLYDFPDIRDALVEVRQAWNEWRMMASQDKVGSIIETGKRDKKLPTINQLYTMIVDEIRPLENLKRIAEEKRGAPLSPTNDPWTLAWMTRGWTRKAENFLKYGTFQLTPEGVKFTGPPLKEILKPVEDAGERHLLDRYLVAKRALSDPRILKGFEGIIEKGDFQQTAKELEPKFKDVAEKLYAYQDELLEYLVDSGRISDQTRNAIKEKNLFYAPFYRLMDVDEPSLGLSRKKFANLFQPIKKLKGSARPIISPTENIIKNTFAIINAAERNKVGEALIKLSQIEGIGQWIEKLPVRITPVMIPTKQLEYVLRRYGTLRETVTYREIKKELGETISQVEGKTPADKVQNVALEALQHRGWTEAEANQILERLKGAKTAGERDKIIEKVIEKTAITEIIREYGFDITDPAVAIFRPNYQTKANEVIFYDRGTPKVYELDSDIYRAVMSLDGDSLGTVTKVFAYPAKWLRAGAVRFSVEFAMKNPVRDQFTAFVFTKYGYNSPFDFMRGIFHLFKQDQLWQKFNASGAAHGSLVSMDRDYVHKTYKDFVGSIGYREMVSLKGVSKMLRNPLMGLQMLTELTEEATRVGEFARGLKKEGETLDGVLEAGKAARDIILDFARIGSKMRGYNAIVAFQNAGIQGLDKMYRQFKYHPGKTSLKAFLYLTLPTLLLWWAQKDDPAYQELPYWRKILCWNIVTHNEDGSTKHIWWIPKPFEIGIIFGSIPEAALDWAYRLDSQAFKETAKELVRVLNPGIIPTGLTPIMEWFANRSWFFDKPIVPRGKEALSPELQYTPHTPESVKLLAEQMAKVPYVKELASPAKITNLIRGYTGAFGYMTLESIDEILKRTGLVDAPIEPMKKISEYPGLRVFTQRWPLGNARSIEDFYREYEKLETRWADMREKAGIRKMGLKIKTPATLDQYRKTARTLSGMRKLATIIYESERSAEEKRMILDSLYLSMINVARIKMGRKPIPIPKIKRQIP